MRNIETRKIGQIAKVKGGKRLPKGMEVQDDLTEHPYLRIVDFSTDGVDRSNIKYISNEAFEFVKRYIISNDDVYISIAGTIGRVGIVPADLSGANLTENAAKITEIDSSMDKNFLMYFLRSPLGQGSIQSKTGGTSQPKLALFRIEEIEIPFLLKNEQKRIAEILSAYDDLIENNLKRIRLLEESARLLYREWFVRLKFPNHEHTPLIDGLPEGWERKSLSEVITLNYGKGLKAEDREDGEFPVYGSSGIVGTHTKALVKSSGIVVGRKGNVGSVFWANKDFFPIDTVYYIENSQCNFFIYHNLQNLPFQNSDGAVPGLNRNYAYSLPIIVPAKSVLDEFERIISTTYEQTFNLETQNQKLKQARDLLLPRLMSGEIAV